MSKEAMKLALAALKELVAQTEGRLFAVKHDHVAMQYARQAITALREALAEQPAQQEPVGCEGAIVNGRVYADRLEHDYKFECEAGPLHLCTDWVEFRRCFEWLAQHTSPPAQRKPQFKEFIKWAGIQGYDCAQTFNSDTGEWICLNPMTADLWRAWQAAHGIKENT